MKLSYRLRPFEDKDEGVFRTMLPHQVEQHNAGLLRWKFLDNPAGRGLVCTCKDEDGKIIGLNAFQRVRFNDPGDGAQMTGFQSMNTFVDPAARGQGVFNRMLQTYYEAADSEFIYGFPNASSAKGFFGRQKWKELGQAPFLIKPLRAGYFLKRISKALPDFQIPRLPRQHKGSSALKQFTLEFIETLQQNSDGIGQFHLSRDASFLNWRIFEKPMSQSHVLQLDGRAFAAGRVTDKHGGKIGYLLEAMGDNSALFDVLSDMDAYYVEKAADAVLAWCLPHSPNYRVLRRAGYFPLPRALRPVTIFFGVRQMSVRADGMETPENWYISYLDSDTV